MRRVTISLSLFAYAYQIQQYTIRTIFILTMKAIHILLSFSLLFCMSCTNSPEKIFEEQKTGVVLICNKFYYDITLPNGEHIYFSGIDGNGNIQGLTSDLAEIKNSQNVLNGTGFFIDKNGRILTNRHVVAPEIDKDKVRNNLNAIIESYAQYIDALQDSINNRYVTIQQYAQQKLYDTEYEYTDVMDDDEINMLNNELENLKTQYVEAQNIKDNIRRNILGYNFSVKLHSQYGIAYDGSNVDKWDDFMANPCEIQKVSTDKETDLALLQLKSKVTPKGKYIYDYFDFDVNIDNRLEINQDLYMIGYNNGVQLAKTNNGINAQFTSGTLTQLPDGSRVLYSIPAMPGSSGSPVIDAKGRLLAVNFAGTNGSDNFNFGIPIIRILTFLK